VAREVADLVLLDDDFATIVAAIEEGRGIYQNILKFVRMLFADNLAELVLILGGIAVSVAAGLRLPDGTILLPLTAVQVLWINLVTDSVPALAMALDRNPDVMSRPPREAGAPILDRRTLRFVGLAGGFCGLAGLALLTALPLTGRTPEVARTSVFCFITVVAAPLALAARRLDGVPPPNRALSAALVLLVALQTAAVTLPGLRDVLGAVPLGAADAGIVAGALAVAWLVVGGLARSMRRAA
jgi:Ca2+-transporting ATPase